MCVCVWCVCESGRGACMCVCVDERCSEQLNNRTVHIRHQCRKSTALSCLRCLINTSVEKNELHLRIEFNFDPRCL